MRLIRLLAAISMLSVLSCKKSAFLNKIPDTSLITPKSLSDIQKILDNTAIMNIGVNPSFGEASSDDCYLINLPLSEPALNNLYCWKDDIYSIKQLEWDFPYRTILYANLVLEELAKINPKFDEQVLYNNIKGSALAYRAEKFFQLAQIFSPPYTTENSTIHLGIPLRNLTVLTETINRSTVGETYDQIVTDLRLSSELLIDKPVSEIKTQPSRASALGLLARTFLTIGKYDSAFKYADKCLSLYDNLMDYNGDPNIDLNFPNPFKQFNSEVIYHSTLIQSTQSIFPVFAAGNLRVDSLLINSYDENDLRKKLFFRKEVDGFSFVGSYDGTDNLFGGVSTDEIFLIRAECNARLGNLYEAMTDLNAVMTKRWKTGAFMPIEASNSQDALTKILTERRKELLFRGLRWSDLRRLNQEGASIMLTRIFNGQLYSLPPNHNRYTFLIPPDVMAFHSDWQQNPR